MVPSGGEHRRFGRPAQRWASQLNVDPLGSVNMLEGRLGLARVSLLVACLGLACADPEVRFFRARFENRSNHAAIATWVMVGPNKETRIAASSERFPPGASYELRVPEVAEWYEFRVQLENGVQHSDSIYFQSALDRSPHLVFNNSWMRDVSRDPRSESSQNTLPNKMR